MDEKRRISTSMIECGDNWTVRGIRLIDSDNLESKELHDLVSDSSTAALRLLSGSGSCEFLSHDPSTWHETSSYTAAKQRVQSVTVINESAERTVALMSSVNESITKNESEMQRLIQVVEDNRS